MIHTALRIKSMLPTLVYKALRILFFLTSATQFISLSPVTGLNYADLSIS